MSTPERLIARYAVRPCRLTDVPLLMAWFGHQRIRDCLDDEAITDDERRGQLIRLIHASPTSHGRCGFIVELQGTPVGFIHLMWINWISRTTEVDLLAAPDAPVGAGFMVMLKSAEIAFEQLNLNKLYGFVYADNPRSLLPIRRLLTVEATMAGAAMRGGKPTDVHIASTSAAQYYRTKAALGMKRIRA